MRGLIAALVLAATVVPADAHAAVGEVLRPAGAEVIAGKYIVTLKKTGQEKTGQANALGVAAAHGGKVDRVYGAALHGFAMTATEQQARRLAADPRVERVEADSVVRGEAVRTNPIWNLDRIDQRGTVLDNRYEYPDQAGQGVTVYVMDTGVRTAHAEFEGRASVAFDAIGDGWNGQDCSTSGHGTHVAGTIAGKTFGVASKAKIASVRVLSCENSGTISQIVAGIDWITANAAKPAVVNMSLGGGQSTTEDNAVKASIAAGISYVVSAGNTESNACLKSPANVSAALTVGAANPVGERARGWGGTDTGSNYGPCLDLFAPGESIESAHNATDHATMILKGTSMASPHVAGAAALLLSQTPTLTPAQVHTEIVNRSVTGVLNPSTLEPPMDPPTTQKSPNRFLYTGPLAQPVCTVSDTTRRTVPDQDSITVALDVTACGRKIATNATVRVQAEHPFRGDLSVRLVTPSGTEVVLREANSADNAVNLDQTFPLSLSTLDANGTWKLIVRDNFSLDEGSLVGWTLTL
ncbi:serine protease [Lentzea flava]|uniref:Serine protease n=1 Tax=Lentzea flava TaxID=103732 RepID=A0ABQ2UAB1_9PSEU|nr:Peptidase inhibitor I9 [Lentzea flava]GGU16176.1 serine protease [Lentzea flava]